MKNTFFYIFVFCCIYNYSIAQNWNSSYCPRYRHIKDLHIHSPEKISIVGGHPFNDSITYMAYSETSGEAWEHFLDIYPGKLINTLLFKNNLNGICAGYNEALYKTNDAGITWQSATWGITLNGRDINKLFAGQYGVMYAAGGLDSIDGFLLKSVDGANTWEIISEWTEHEINTAYSPKHNYIVVAGATGFMQLTSDGGESWQDCDIPEFDFPLEITSIDFIDENNGICAGGQRGIDSVSIILKTNNGGESWQLAYNEISTCLNDINFASPEVIYAVGDYGLILKSEDGGSSWVEEIIADNPGEDFYTVEFLNSHIGAISGKWGNVFTYNDGEVFVPEISTLEASEVQDNQAVLNAIINTGFSESEVYFVYGTDESPENEIFVGTFSDGESQNIDYLLSNLQSDSKYYYYARLTNIYGEYLGDIKSFYTGNPIPNWDFELWSIEEFDFPDNWYSVGKIEKQDYGGDICIGLLSPESTDGHDDISVVMNAKIEGEGIEQDWHIPAEFVFGGLEINSRPETLFVDMSYNVEEGDTAVVFLGLFEGVNYVAENFFFITGSSSASIVNKEFEISYLNSNTPDRLVIAITNSNPFNYENNWNSNVSVSKIWFDDSEITLLNDDFNEWTTVSYDLPENWQYKTKNGFGSSIDYNLPFFKTSDAYFNESAIVLQNIITSNDSIAGKIYLKDYNQGIVINKRFETFSGYYKFFPENSDTARINLTMYKAGEQIGWGYFDQTDIIDVWSKFDIEINYNDGTVIPDSMNIILEASQWPIRGESKLYLDKLTFDGDYIPVEKEFAASFRLYPNPVDDILTILVENHSRTSKCRVKIVDINGKIQYNCIIDAKSNILIDVASLERGVYIVLLEYKKSTVSKRFIKI